MGVETNPLFFVDFKNSSSVQGYLLALLLVLLLSKILPSKVLFAFRSCNSKERSEISLQDRTTFRYDKYESLPGPPQLPIIGALHHLRDLRGTLQMLRDFGDIYGPVAKFNLFHETFVVFNNAPMSHAVLSSNDMDHFRKPPFFYDVALGQILGTGLITSAGQQWKSHRKLLSPAFSYKSFQNYCKIFIKSSDKLVTDLEELFEGCEEGETRQINTAIHCCGLQIITEAVMGLELYNDEDGLTFLENIKRSKDLFGRRLHKPILMLDFFWRFHPLSREYDRVVETLNGITKKMITKRKLAKETSEEMELTDGKTMMDEMLKANMSDLDILYEVNTIIFAGFETTSSSVHFLMFLLALNQEHQELCREEVKRTLADPMVCPNGELTFDAISELKYLERCLNEAMRFFPPVFVFGRKLDKPLKLNETLTIPKGVNVAVPPLTLHTNPEYFPSPEKFDPDRFLPENVKTRQPGAYLPFSSGARTCIGMKFAIMAAKTMAAQILLHFDVQSTDKIGDVVLLPNIFLTPERDYNFILKRRK